MNIRFWDGWLSNAWPGIKLGSWLHSSEKAAPSLELRQLKYFVAIAESNFSRAAERLHVAQPALSRQMRDLESEIGSTLFIRGGNRLALTPSGTAFLREAKVILAQSDWAMRSARLAAEGKTGLLRVGYVATGLYSPTVLRNLRQFRATFPGVHVALEQMSPVRQMGALVSNTIDVAIVHGGIATLNQFRVNQLLDEPMGFMMPRDHPLARAERLRLVDFAADPVVMISRHVSPSFYDRMMATWLERGFHPRIAQESDSFATSVVLVASGAGISFAGESAAAHLTTAVLVRQVDDFLFRSAIDLVTRPTDDSPIVEAFVRALTTPCEPD